MASVAAIAAGLDRLKIRRVSVAKLQIVCRYIVFLYSYDKLLGYETGLIGLDY